MLHLVVPDDHGRSLYHFFVVGRLGYPRAFEGIRRSYDQVEQRPRFRQHFAHP